MYIIGDVAGQYSTLLALVAKLPDDAKIILLGDLVDRGPDSAKVVAFAMANSDRVKCIKGNHEDMMIDYHQGLSRYEVGVWKDNGGGKTILSYRQTKENIMEHLRFLKTLPTSIEFDDLYLSHAPYTTDIIGPEDVLWNRHEPEKKDKFMIFGHNSAWGLTINDKWACIDTSKDDILTAMHWPSKAVIQQEYI